MKTTLLAVALITIVTPASAGNPNYGKADDYGSERFALVNQCLARIVAHETTNRSIPDCMSDHGYRFQPNAQVFGNSGGKCKNDSQGVFHSWCWEKVN
jgi:hypothetical protein